MQAAQIRITAQPVADHLFQTDIPELRTMPQEHLRALVNKAVKWPAGTNKTADAVLAEWNGRVGYRLMERDKAEYAEEQADVSFRMEVMDELIHLGFARHVAADMTNTEAKLMAKAREIKFI